MTEDPQTIARKLLREGNLPQAIRLYSELVQADPTNAQHWLDLGMAYLLQNQAQLAEAPLRQAVRIQPNHLHALNNLASTLYMLGKREEAIPFLKHALLVDPQFLDALVNLGNIMIDLGRYGEASAILQHALGIKPTHVPVLNNIGRLHNRQGRHEDAVPYFRKALGIDPNSFETLHNFGIALGQLGQFDEAIDAYRRVIALKPDHAFTYNSLGNVYRNVNRIPEALAQYEQAIAVNPNYPEAHLGRALAWLVSGDFARGWPEYEWRLRFQEFSPRTTDVPRWEGGPLNGRSILLLPDQGLGDTIHFVRYAPMVKATCGRVLLECPRPLWRLLESFVGIDQLLLPATPGPPIDVHCPLASLPGIFRTSLATIPVDMPYLYARPALIERWRARLEPHPGFRIGVIWQGEPKNSEDRRRSFPLRLMAPIAKLPGVCLVSLQKGFGTEQIANCGFPIVDFGPSLDEANGPFMDTAALMKNVDLVISADTATAHLAGALAAPLWIALPFAADWRWLQDRDDSPWYPTARLFRQPQRNDWASVFAKMATVLVNTNPTR